MKKIEKEELITLEKKSKATALRLVTSLEESKSMVLYFTQEELAILLTKLRDTVYVFKCEVIE